MSPAWPSPWLGLFALVAAAVIYDLLLTLVRRADRAYPSTNPTESTWWFGYARDLSNLIGMVGFTVGFHLLGFPGPQALLAGCVMALIAYGVDYMFARTLASHSPALLVAAVTFLFVGVAIVFRVEVQGALSGMLDDLF